MLDYRGLEALYTVILLNSFEAAAQKLHLSQSAISQRIKNLENQYGHSLLSRSNPYKPTKLGSTLLQHFRQIHLLETSLNYQLEKSKEKPTYTIALSRDCMETWFLDFLHAHDITNALLLDIITVDQEKTIEYVKRGMAAACISTSNKKSHGTKSIFLGEMEYLLVATPKYLQKHFLSDDPKSFFENAVALKFDQEDHLMNDYLKKYFPKQTNNIELNYHYLPSVAGFKKFTLKSRCYALLPKIDMMDEWKKKSLVEIFPGKRWKIPLYLHYWDNYKNPFKEIHDLLLAFTKKRLF